jgi:hypothetical protein
LSHEVNVRTAVAVSAGTAHHCNRFIILPPAPSGASYG